MWRKRSPSPLLVGMLIHTATMENCMEVPLKTKNRTTIWSSNPTPGHISRKQTLIQKYTCTPMFIAALFTTAKTWKQPKVPINRWLVKEDVRASLVAQWLRICLPMQGTRVQSLVWEDPTCCRATKLVCHNYWACALEPVSHNYWAHVPQLLKPARLEPVLQNERSHCNEKPAHRNEE